MHTSILTLTALFGGVLAPAVSQTTGVGDASTPVEQCVAPDLRAGPLPGGGRLGPPVYFDDGMGIYGGCCHALYDGAQFVSWVDMFHQAGSRTILRRCVEIPGLVDVGPGSKGGAIEEDLEELRFAGQPRRPTFVKFDLPLWSEFANASFSGAYLAYWGAAFEADKPVRVFAVVFDVGAGRVVRQEALGSVHLEADSHTFFARPLWSADGARVIFDAAGKVDISNTRLPAITLQVK